MRITTTFAIATMALLTSCLSTGGEDLINTTTPTNTSTSSDTAQSAVERHNAIRAEVFSGSQMVWDATVATTAQEYANYLAATGLFQHDSSGYGENLYAASYQSSYADAINSWYSEKAYYDYATNSCAGVCGHYTQIVWKDSTKVGCGKATYTTGAYRGGVVIVCRYDPAGNYVGQRPY